MCTYHAVLIFTLAKNAHIRPLSHGSVQHMIEYCEEAFLYDEDSIPRFE